MAFIDEEVQEDENGEITISGEELFRSLLRLLPIASPWDYFKNGRWEMETLQIDIELLEAHRKEAAAPELPPLDEVKLPADMPRAVGGSRFAGSTPVAVSSWGGTRRVEQPLSAPSSGPVTIVKPIVPAKIRPVVPKLVTPVITKPETAPPGAGRTASELQRIGDFIDQWGLEATKAKLGLAKLNPMRRRWVLEHFQGDSSLEEFIEENNRNNWPDLPAPTSSTPVKRPFENGVAPDAKRPRPPSYKPPSALIRPTATYRVASSPSSSGYAAPRTTQGPSGSYTRFSAPSSGPVRITPYQTSRPAPAASSYRPAPAATSYRPAPAAGSYRPATTPYRAAAVTSSWSATKRIAPRSGPKDDEPAAGSLIGTLLG
eukprot:TRINITY_DN14401_c1_g3_i4.p1 TRINITY_DN14401_c1_g3~~TRINITY_DN14401_c1_g3_i4.p1  ORF type:complete len:373 (-),score=57.65 TRINITY_DN14401_c1_g3_i4:420-1538(-)